MIVYGDNSGTSTESSATVAMNAAGWWYFACVYRFGYAEIYVAQPSDATLAYTIAVSAGGSADVVEPSGVNKLYLMSRYDPLGTVNNCGAGTRLSNLSYHAGVALSKYQLTDRFNHLKSEYL